MNIRIVISILAGAFALAPWGDLCGQATQSASREVSGARPLAQAADILEGLYAKPVTYEDPVWKWIGDLSVPGKDPAKKWALIPRRRTFTLQSLGTGALSEPSQAVLGAVLASYLDQNRDGPGFRFLKSKFGLHIVPSENTEISGKRIVEVPLLDRIITVSAAPRRLMEQVQAIGDEVARATGVEVRANTPMLGFGLERLFSGADPTPIVWGSSGVPARDALMGLLDRSATTLSWRLLCQPSESERDRFCVLSVTPIHVLTAGRDGISRDRVLEFDRCGRCPPLKPPAPMQ